MSSKAIFMNHIWYQQYQAGVPKEINPDAYPSVAELFQRSCERFADQPAVSNMGHTLSYRELAQLSQQFAAYLTQKLNLKKGDRIAIMLPNVLQYPVVMFGALQAGLIVVNVNPLYTVTELVHQIKDAGATTIVVLANFANVVAQALPRTHLKNIIITEIGDLFPWPKSFLINSVVKYIKKKVPAYSLPQAISFRQIIKESRALHWTPVAINGDDIAFLQYTGGTTGIAKGAILTHRNIVANVEQVVAWVSPVIEYSKEIIITPLPLYHIFSLTANCLSFLHFGALNILITNPRDISGFVKTLRKTPFTILTGVNTLFNALLNDPEFAEINFSHLKVALGGGAAIQKCVAERWQKVTGKVLLEGYGLTETSPVVCVCPMNLAEYNGSIGLPISSTDVQLKDEAGNNVAETERGELCVKGPQVMRGYWQHPEETKKVFTADGWLRTGDIARMDDKGFFYIVDRKKDMILVSGFNVYPNEVEDVIAAQPGVLEAAVIGVPNGGTGEAIKAFVVRKDPKLTAEDVRLYCREHLTGYKIPKYIEFRDSLPKSPVGKVLRRELRN
jgi:long-chain acyl-CoA synthetase